MNDDDTDPLDQLQPCGAECQLRRLVRPQPWTCAGKRIDVILEPDFDLLWGREP